MTDDMQETPKKADKPTSTHEDATVISARSMPEKKPVKETQAKDKIEKMNDTPVPDIPPEIKPEPLEQPPVAVIAQPEVPAPSLNGEVPPKNNKRTVLIIVVVVVVLLCCCCAAIIGITMAFGGWQGIQDFFNNMGMLDYTAFA